MPKTFENCRCIFSLIHMAEHIKANIIYKTAPFENEKYVIFYLDLVELCKMSSFSTFLRKVTIIRPKGRKFVKWYYTYRNTKQD